MTVGKVKFEKEKETMLMILYPRAVQSKWKKPILLDPWAEEAIRHIDYDFSKIDRMGGIFAGIGSMIVATRAATFDMLTKRYLAEHPNAIVLHLGCGMDTRVFRVDPPATVSWYDVDYPDVIDLHRRLYPEKPGYHLVGSPLDDLRWLDEVPGDRPVLAIAEGVFMYMAEVKVKALFNKITGHFPSGQFIFDALPSWVVKHTGLNVGKTGATYKWALDNPQDVKRLDPKLEFIEEYGIRERVAFSRFPLVVRVFSTFVR